MACLKGALEEMDGYNPGVAGRLLADASLKGSVAAPFWDGGISGQSVGDNPLANCPGRLGYDKRRTTVNSAKCGSCQV